MRIFRSSKKFLAEDIMGLDEFGNICWSIESKLTHTPWVSGNLRIGDCGKAINLDFYINSSERYLQRMKKLQTLISSLREFQLELEQQWDFVKAIMPYHEPLEEEEDATLLS